MFKLLGAKAIAILTAISGALLFIVSLLWKSNKKKNDIIAGHEKKDEIIDDMKLADIQAEVKEKDAQNAIDDSDYINRI